MANEIGFDGGSSSTIPYLLLWNDQGEIYNGTGFEVPNILNYLSYPISMLSTGMGFKWLADFPAVAAGRYRVVAVQREGSTPSPLDSPVGQSKEYAWDGTQILTLLDMTSSAAVALDFEVTDTRI